MKEELQDESVDFVIEDEGPIELTLFKTAIEHILRQYIFEPADSLSAKNILWQLKQIFSFDIAVEVAPNDGNEYALVFDLTIGDEIYTIDVVVSSSDLGQSL